MNEVITCQPAGIGLRNPWLPERVSPRPQIGKMRYWRDGGDGGIFRRHFVLELPMIHIAVAYPDGEGHTFDHDYYANKHMAMVKDRIGSALLRTAVDRGIAGPTPGSAPAWLAVGHLYFDSVEAFQAAFGPHGAEIMGDLPNFTNIQPTMVISEVVGE